MRSELAVQPYPDASVYADADIRPEFDADPITPMVTLARSSPVIEGSNNLYRGVHVPNIWLFPEQQMFLAVDRASVMELCRDNETWSSYEAFKETFVKLQGDVMITMDEPKHRRYKKMVMPSFAHRMINEGVNALTRPAIDSCLDSLYPKGEMELISEFAAPYTFNIIAEMLGITEQDRLGIASATRKLLLMAEDPQTALTAKPELDAIYQGIIDRHREQRRDDITQILVDYEEAGEQLSDEEIRNFLSIIMGAGQDTTKMATASLVMRLLENPEQLAMLRADRSLIPGAVWEGLRYDPPANSLPRVALTDTELGGVTIPAGSGIIGMIGAANRDETVWEDSARFDITRPKKPIMTFSAGVHSCLGQSLSLVELENALAAMLDKLPNLRKDENRWHCAKMRGYGFRSPTQIPVKWDT